MEVEASLTANAPVDRVWAILFDEFEHISRWFTQCTDSGAIEGAAGTKARFVAIKAGRLEERVTDHNATTHRMSYAVVGLPFLVRRAGSHWSLDADGEGTRVGVRMTVEMLPVLGWPAQPFLRMALSGVTKALAGDLARYAETGAKRG